ncbi:invasion associated locus B family protein [Rhodobacteraceae bacterium CCMM004]|nr:invasion associated locus B family protein [Rhodobacteraceae bacterium CCMM004]
MPEYWKIIALTAAIAVAGPAAAQQADTADEPAPVEEPAETEAPADTDGTDTTAADALGLSTGEEVPDEGGLGATYIREEHGDWSVRCVRTEGGDDPCQLYQLIGDGAGNSVAEMSIFPLPAGQNVAAGATIITPLETLLTQQITLTVDGGAVKRYPFTFCAVNGCFARLGFTSAEVAAFKRGAKATMIIVPAAAPDQRIPLTVSLTGFTAGYDSLGTPAAE